ncbi:hypothetical protein CHH55_02510 [Niallia circulans]|uniref:hypothetical protein n=1 Tax=Niallia circulans TaxID=1397 RepID=UPI000BA52308|nr:hypothetical protein [Niallia circulans]PAD27016.1 hypothetical protein CHH62_02620 [Niallia circulans]PAD89535.1 hypothetical protein CHH55_02510 [Niallia circulans]
MIILLFDRIACFYIRRKGKYILFFVCGLADILLLWLIFPLVWLIPSLVWLISPPLWLIFPLVWLIFFYFG